MFYKLYNTELEKHSSWNQFLLLLDVKYHYLFLHEAPLSHNETYNENVFERTTQFGRIYGYNLHSLRLAGVLMVLLI